MYFDLNKWSSRRISNISHVKTRDFQGQIGHCTNTGWNLVVLLVDIFPWLSVLPLWLFTSLKTLNPNLYQYYPHFLCTATVDTVSDSQLNCTTQCILCCNTLFKWSALLCTIWSNNQVNYLYFQILSLRLTGKYNAMVQNGWCHQLHAHLREYIMLLVHWYDRNQITKLLL